MTIDEARNMLMIIENSTESLKTAIEIMRKYQKIEEAYKKYLNDMVTNIYADRKFIVALRGILEDGNDTTNTGSN